MPDKIGQLALAKKWITAEELDFFLSRQNLLREAGEAEAATRLGTLLVRDGLLSEAMIETLLVEQRWGMDFLPQAAGAIFGRYRIEGLLARGGTGAVYRAIAMDNNRLLAIKVIRDRGFTGKVRAGFLREIRILSQLDHPNIVRIYDYGQTGGVDFLAMEYLEGEPLEKAMSGDCAWFKKFSGLLDAVKSMHEHNIVHRDLKPANIMVVGQRLVIFDFGLGKILEESQAGPGSSQIAGTPAYMAPEQTIPGGRHDARTDIWALGVILYRLATATLPFPQQQLPDLLYAIRHRDPILPTAHNPRLPERLNGVCMRALAKNPQHRYPSVAEMAQDLEEIVTVLAPPPPEEGKIPKVSGSRQPYQVHQAGAAVPGEFFLHYRLIRHLGCGGMGTVYQAYDTKLKRTVALKLLLPERRDKDARRFLQEASAVARLNHPNIVKLLEAGDEPQHYFTMEYIEGETLLASLHKKILSPKEVAEILLKISLALAVAHEAGIIHRDLKPSNIMLGSDREPKLMDFGLAKTLESDLSQSGDILGTLPYMAPEQADGRAVDARSDVYSLGATCYEAITRRPPFQGSQGQILQQIFFADPVSPRALDPSVPADLEAICWKCLEKNPARRYQSAAALARDWQSFLENRPVTARRPNMLTHLYKFVLRHLAFALAIACILLTLLGGGIFSFAQWQRAESAGKESEAQFREAQRQKSEAERQELLKTREARAGSIMLARIAIDKAADMYDNRQYGRCGVLAGRGLEFLQSLSGGDVDDLRSQGRALVKIAMARYPMRWQSHSPYHLGGLVAYSPDGSKMAMVGRDRTVRLWDLMTGEERGRLGLSHSVMPVPFIAALAYSPKEDAVAFSAYEKTVTIWDVRSNAAQKLIGHTDLVTALAFSPDGRLLASAAGDGNIILWQGGKTVAVLKGHTGRVLAVVFNPCGEGLASGGEDGKVILWDLTGPRNFLCGHTEAVYSLAFSPDGKILISGSEDKTIAVWNPATLALTRRLTGHVSGARFLAFSPGGELFASAASSFHDRDIILWDCGKERARLSGHRQAITSLTMSTTGELASVGYGEAVRFWDIRKAAELERPNGHAGAVTAVAFSPDGKVVASAAYDGSVILWDAGSGRRIGKLPGHDSYVFSLAFSRDGATLASGSFDGEIILWDMATCRAQARWRGPEYVMSLSFSRDGSTLASSSNTGVVTLWDTTGRPKYQLPGRCGVFSGGPVLALAEEAEVIWWDVEERREIRRFSCSASISHIALDCRDHTLCAETEDALWLWDIESGKEIATIKSSQAGHRICAALHPKVDILAYTSSIGRITFWDIKHRCALGEIDYQGELTELAFSPDGDSLACAAGSKIQLWAAGAQEQITVLAESSRPFSALAWSCGKLAYATQDVISLWDEERSAVALQWEKSGITAIAIDPAGKVLASASCDKDIVVWDTLRPQATITLAGHLAYVKFLALSTDGQLLSSVDADNAAYIWDKTSGKRLSGVDLNCGSPGEVRIVLRPGNVGSSSVGTSLSRDGRICAHIASHAVLVWDIHHSRLLAQIPSDSPQSLVLNADGSLLAIASSNEVGIWDMEDLGHRALPAPAVHLMVFSADSRLLATASATASNLHPTGLASLELWDTAAGKSVKKHDIGPGKVTALAFSPDGLTLAFASGTNENWTLSRWRIVSRNLPPYSTPPWADDWRGKEFATMQIWDTRADIPGDLVEMWLSQHPRQITQFLFDLEVDETFSAKPFSWPHLWE